MPLYAYTCSACGPFEVRRPMAAASEPADCPACAQRGVRLYTAPGTTSGSAAARADAVDERSRHAPERVVRGDNGHGHGHSHDHGTGAHRSPGRPWQISH